MGHQVDGPQGAGPHHAGLAPRSPADVEAIVVLTRLHLYNRGRPCGEAALRRYLHQHEGLWPLPSTRRIRTILRRYGLTYGRLGWENEERLEDLPVWVPASAWVPPLQRRYLDWDLDGYPS
jgi:hypothetical protein